MLAIYARRATRPTARALAEYIASTGVETTLENNGDAIVFWGSSYATDGSDIPTLNSQAPRPKHEALELMKGYGLPVPNFISPPALLRKTMHSRGRGLPIHPPLNRFAVQYIPKEEEYRVEVFLNEAFRVHKKTGPIDTVSWNRHTPGVSWTTYGLKGIRDNIDPDLLELAKQAVSAVHYDFGAVDIIRSAEDGQYYVLEVNSAPALRGAGLRKWGNRIINWYRSVQE